MLFKKENIISLVFFVLCGSLYSQGNPGISFGGQKNENGFNIIACDDGGFLIGGSTKSFGYGSSDMLAIKIDHNANIEWMNAYGWPHHDVCRSVVEVNDGYIIMGDAWDWGHILLDMFIIKTDLSGNLLWHKYYGTDAQDFGFDIKLTNQGDLLLLGYTRGIDPAGDLLLIKIDQEGNELWRNNYGSQYDDYGFELEIRDDNTILLVGSKAGFYHDVASATYYNVHDADILLISVDNNGDEIWRHVYGGDSHDFGNSVFSIGDEIFIGGSTQSQGNGSFDMYLSKTDSQGNILWSNTFGGEEYEYANSICMNTEGNIYVLGSSKSYGKDGSADIYLVKTNNNGDEIWNLSLGGSFLDIGKEVIPTPDGGALILGNTNSFGNGGTDILLIKVSKDGVVENILSNGGEPYYGKLQLYPNPISEYGYFKSISSNQIPELFLEVISISGQVLNTYTINAPDYQFSINNLSSGVYIYNIRKDEASGVIFRGKLIVR